MIDSSIFDRDSLALSKLKASDWGVLEKLLFAGQYLRSDGSGTAVFENNGKIQRLDSLGYYEPVVDYADFATRVDHIRLGRDKHHYNDYGLRLVGDTMMPQCYQPDLQFLQMG